jgi:hypothetical protein
MAFTDTTVYTGKDLEGFYSKALLTGNTKSVVKFYPNVKSKVKIARLDVSGIIQADSCEFNAFGDTALSQKTLEVCPLKVNLEYCVTTFEANYLSEQLRAGSNTGQVMPESTEAYLLDQVSKNISADLEQLIWQGDSAGSPADLCDGWLVQFEADAEIIDVGAAVLSAANIIAQIGLVYDAIPATVVNSTDLVIFVSTAAIKFYRQALATGGNFAAFNAGDLNPTYLGIPLMVAEGLPTNEMVAAEKGNLWFGSDLMSDFDDVVVIPQYKITGAPTVRLAVRFKFGTSYGVGTEIVYYH